MIPPRDNAGSGSFVTTPWSLLFALREASHPRDAREILDGICAIYWRPVNIFVRAYGYDYDDAQDLTQRFILHLIERDRFTRADPARGRFRSYLLGALKYFLAHVRQDERAQKRGGNFAVISLDEAITGETEDLSGARGAPVSSHASDRQWAQAIHRRITDRIAGEYIVGGKAEVYYTLRPHLAAEKKRGAYEEAARLLRRSAATIRSDVARLRARYRTLLLEELHAQAPGENVRELVREYCRLLAAD
jgi:RNA polymerase sigma-70 factor (ECF subfamily)